MRGKEKRKKINIRCRGVLLKFCKEVILTNMGKRMNNWLGFVTLKATRAIIPNLGEIKRKWKGDVWLKLDFKREDTSILNIKRKAYFLLCFLF